MYVVVLPFHSPQSRPNASPFPPLTAASTASASSLNASTSSPSSLLFNWSFISGAVTPSARCRASSRSGPLSLSMDMRSAGRLGCEASVFRIDGDVAAMCALTLEGRTNCVGTRTYGFVLVRLERFRIVTFQWIWVCRFFNNIGPI